MEDKIVREHVYYGSAGNPKAFYDEKHKHTVEVFPWLKNLGLDSYEYQGGNGITAGEGTLKKIGESAKENGILLSIHAPYYISLTSEDEAIRNKTLAHILKSAEAAKVSGAYCVVIHTGSVKNGDRVSALERARATIESALVEIYSSGEPNFYLGLETMGKESQLGTLGEVVNLCGIDKILSPVVDFGHLNARSSEHRLKTEDDYKYIFDYIAEKLGDAKAKYLHCHFSKIEYTQKGEKKHLTFEDNVFGPQFEPLGDYLAKNAVYPNILCESDGVMAQDALFMKNYYISKFNLEGKNG